MLTPGRLRDLHFVNHTRVLIEILNSHRQDGNAPDVLMGDYVLTQNDCETARHFEDVIGQAADTAAALALHHDTAQRGVYEKHLRPPWTRTFVLVIG